MESRVRPARFVAAIMAASLMSCVTVDINDYCNHSSEQAIRNSDPGSLALILGVPPQLRKDPPQVMFYSPSQLNSKRSISAKLVPLPQLLPVNLDESHCSGVDWSSYSLVVDADEWRAFWTDDQARHFEIGVEVLNGEERLRLESFGAAIVDARSGAYYFSCGCYWQ